MKTDIEAAEILLATYNGEKYVREQIKSICSQTYTNWHLTISDDGSTDGTGRIIDEYVAKYPDKMTRHVSGMRFGNARDHFFYLMRVCGARYMFFCDQDDVWYPDKMKRLMDKMLQAEAEHGKEMPILVFSDQVPTDRELNPLAPSLMRYQKQFFETFDYRSILMQNVVTGGAMCINRALAELAGKCSDTTNVIMHDWWMAVVAARFGKIGYIDEPLSAYRQHGDNSVGAKDVRNIGYVVKCLMNLKEIKKRIQKKKNQAAYFAEMYFDLLSVSDVKFIEAYRKRHSGLMFYMQNIEIIHGFGKMCGFLLLG